MKNFNKILKGGFTRSVVSYEKSGEEYVLYNNSKFLWINTKNKMITCENIETLQEIDKRCNLGLFKK
jgi:hypothetical protein